MARSARFATAAGRGDGRRTRQRARRDPRSGPGPAHPGRLARQAVRPVAGRAAADRCDRERAAARRGRRAARHPPFHRAHPVEGDPTRSDVIARSISCASRSRCQRFGGADRSAVGRGCVAVAASLWRGVPLRRSVIRARIRAIACGRTNEICTPSELVLLAPCRFLDQRLGCLVPALGPASLADAHRNCHLAPDVSATRPLMERQLFGARDNRSSPAKAQTSAPWLSAIPLSLTSFRFAPEFETGGRG